MTKLRKVLPIAAVSAVLGLGASAAATANTPSQAPAGRPPVAAGAPGKAGVPSLASAASSTLNGPCGESGGGLGEEVGEWTHEASEALEGAGKSAGVVGESLGEGSAGEGVTSAGEGLGMAGEGLSYIFAGLAFKLASDTFHFAGADPTDMDFETMFTPVFVAVPAVKAPEPRLAGAFQSLNQLFGTEIRFAEVVVALRTSLDRAEGAATAGDQLWLGRQADASAEYALQASTLLKGFPRLNAAVERAFVADGLVLRVTPQQFAAAQAELAHHGLAPEFTHLLGVATGALRPQTSAEVKALRALLLDTAPFEQAILRATPTTLDLPAVLGSRSLTSAEDRAAAALQSYANYVLHPNTATAHAQLQVFADPCSGGGDSFGDSYGDTHEVTFSGDDYDFQAAGEFTLVKSTTDNLDVQIREQPFPGTGDVAVNTATAMRAGKTIVELAGDRSGQLLLWVNRKAVPLASRALPGGGTLSVEPPSSATVTWPDGTQVTVFSTSTGARTEEMDTCNIARAIYVDLSVPRSRFGHLTGLLGDAGASASSDLVGGNGVHYSLDEIGFPYDSVRNYDVLYHQFGQSWRIRQQDSLFVYPKGMSTRSYTNLAFPSEALTIPSLAPTKISGAERACKAAGITNPDLLADCVFDVGVTGESCFAGGDAQIQATTGGPPVTDMPPSSGTVPSTPAGTHLTVDSQADSTGPVVVDSAGNGYVAWDSHARGDEADHVLFCKIPAGGTCTHKITLALPGNSTNSQDAIVQPFPVLGRAPGVVYVVGPRYVRSDVVVWTSHDGGSTFSAGVTVPSPSYVGNTGVDDVLQSPLNPSTAIDYFSIASNNVGLGYSFTGPGTVGGPSPASFTFNTGGVPGSVLGATLGFSGQQMVEAFWTDADTPTVDYYWSPTYELGGAQSALEHGPTKVSDGTNARLASGPEGLFLLSEDSGGASKPLRLHLRKWDPSTHTFGSLTFVGLVANDMDSANQGGLAEDAATGALYVAWPGHDANGNYVMYLWTSTNGGKAFSGPTTVADINSAYEGPARLAATGGHGFLTFQDGGGLELVDLASL